MKRWVICQYCHLNIYHNQKMKKTKGMAYFMHKECYLKSLTRSLTRSSRPKGGELCQIKGVDVEESLL